MLRPIICALGAAMLLASCSQPAGNHAAAPAANGADAMMAMDKPDGTPFDIHGVPVYPGSTMADVKIMPHMPDDDMMYGFDSPAAPSVVRDWLAGELARDGYHMTVDGKDLVGTDPRRQPLRIALEPAPGGHTLGTITLGN